MLRLERKTKNENAGFFRLNARKLAKSKHPASQKSTRNQRLMRLFTADYKRISVTGPPMAVADIGSIKTTFMVTKTIGSLAGCSNGRSLIN